MEGQIMKYRYYRKRVKSLTGMDPLNCGKSYPKVLFSYLCYNYYKALGERYVIASIAVAMGTTTNTVYSYMRMWQEYEKNNERFKKHIQDAGRPDKE